ncbi:MAG: hypothetical protein V1246_09305 [Arenicellales bacterium]|nr:hypothetical protein [Arenicellales bacterium]MEE1567996.1 hypothetical protein [Arenicellales bacterium]
MNSPLRPLFLVPMLVLAGCFTTLSSFEQMTPTERAAYACKRHQNIRALDREIDRYSDQLLDIETALSAGYRVHESCKSTPVVVPGTVTCTTDAGSGKTTCTDTSYTTYEQVCEEIPVAIDYRLEKDKKADASAKLQVAMGRRQDKYDKCYAAVKSMSPAQAFAFFKSIK